MYKLFYGFMGTPFVIRLSDNTYIPFEDGNADYQAYLKWLAEGNQPLPADEGTPPA